MDVGQAGSEARLNHDMHKTTLAGALCGRLACHSTHAAVCREACPDARLAKLLVMPSSSAAAPAGALGWLGPCWPENLGGPEGSWKSCF